MDTAVTSGGGVSARRRLPTVMLTLTVTEPKVLAGYLLLPTEVTFVACFLGRHRW
jgi:hypothetical protein